MQLHRRSRRSALPPAELKTASAAAFPIPIAYELLVESVVDYAIYMLDLEGRVASWNAGAQRIKGYGAAEVIGGHFSRFYTPEDLDDGLPTRALETARREGRYEAEGWRLRKDGSRFWAMVVIDAIYDEGRLVGFAKVTRDLSERREAQLQLERSREQLFQSQKMEAVGQLTGGLAHDFNNLLTAISGSLELMKLRLAQGRTEDLAAQIEAAESAAARAAALTHRLLAFSRRQVLDPVPTEANRVVAGMEELIGRSIGPGVQLAIELAEEAWPIFCDANQLENALLNLCLNARDAMPDGGRLAVSTTNERLDEAQGRMLDLPPGDYVALRVSDTGTGMAPEVVSRAFDPFFTTKPLGQGTGLGLSMVYGFARQSDGQVRIHSAPGQGTTVTIRLPRRGVPLAAPADAPAEPAPEACAEPGETVLVVDDEALIRMVVAQVLQEAGYTVLQAGTGAAGLAILQSAARIDLLVSDVGLPGGMNGRQLADAARVARPGLKVLFITGYAESAVMGQGGLEPGMHVLTKPFGLEQLGGRIRAILGGASPTGLELPAE
jgi:PAS domain S-box-containing protein